MPLPSWQDSLWEQVVYLEIAVGDYCYALPAHSILGIEQDVVLSPIVTFRDLRLPACDLRAFWGSPSRHVTPFLVAFEGGSHPVAIGVDRVSYLRHQTGSLLNVSKLGLLRPDVVLGAIRHESRLLVVLQPVALAIAIIQISQTI